MIIYNSFYTNANSPVFRAKRTTFPLPCIWDYYTTHPERAIPVTVSEQIQYRATLEEFIRFMADPRMEVRKITSQYSEKFAQHLKKSGLAVDPHNRKIKCLRKIFYTLIEFRNGENR